MYQCESCAGTTALKEFLDQELNKHEDHEKLNYCQWDTTDQAILTNLVPMSSSRIGSKLKNED